MDIIISHMAALEAMRRPTTLDRLTSGAFAQAGAAAPSRMPRADSLERLESLGLSNGRPIGILVSSKSATHASRMLSPHVWSRELPPGAVFELAPGIGCVSPLLLPVLLAPRLNGLELRFLLAELMGLYAYAPSDELLQRNRPLIDAAGTAAFAESLGPAGGTRRVVDALGSVPAMSASPMETCLHVRATSAYARGGYRMGEVVMNDPVEVERLSREVPAIGVRKPDLMFAGPRGKASIDYMGSQHLATVRRDARRRNELLAAGITPFEIFKDGYDDLDHLDALMDAVKREVGLPLHVARGARREKELQARRGLWSELEAVRRRSWEQRPELW